jgi:CheY-like chemotaxis protein
MGTLKILIVEDEVLSAMGFQERLLEFGYANVALAKDSFEAIYAFKTQKPDLVLMDITLEGSQMDGIEIVEVFNEMRRVPIIYISSNTDDKTIDRAKKTHPSSYLVKPCTDKQMEIAIDLAIETFSSDRLFEDDAIFVKNETNYTKKLLPKQVVFHRPNGYLELVPIDDLVYCEADGDTTKVFLKDYKQNDKREDIPTLIAMRNIGFYAKRLLNDFNFFRVSDKIVLNLDYLRGYYHNQRELKLTNGRSLPAAKRGGKALKDSLGD